MIPHPLLPCARCARALLLAACFVLSGALASAAPATQVPIKQLRDTFKQPATWFATDEAHRITETVLFYQYPVGGWPKNLDMVKPLDAAARERFAKAKIEAGIDNGATYTQVRYLAHVIATAAPADDVSAARAAFERGLDYLFAAQYAHGGWPQFFPLKKGYYTHITYNDDAMANVLRLMDDIARARAPFEFVDAARRARATDAFTRGLDCVLRTQVVRDGRRTVWCAQHDETTFAPAPARAFEPVSLSGAESVALVEVLMSVENPSPAIIAAVDGAIAWFERTPIKGQRLETFDTPEGKDRRLVPDPAAPPLWARFYELETDRPIFLGRDSAIHYDYAQIERERRIGYAYFNERPARLLAKNYDAWSQRVRPLRTASAATTP